MRLAPARIRASSCGDQPVGTRVEARGPTTGRVAMRKEAEMLGRSGASRPGGTPPGSASEDRRSAAEMTLLTIVGDSARVEGRSEEHTSELQSLTNLVCRLLLEKKNNKQEA